MTPVAYPLSPQRRDLGREGGSKLLAERGELLVHGVGQHKVVLLDAIQDVTLRCTMTQGASIIRSASQYR